MAALALAVAAGLLVFASAMKGNISDAGNGVADAFAAFSVEGGSGGGSGGDEPGESETFVGVVELTATSFNLSPDETGAFLLGQSYSAAYIGPYTGNVAIEWYINLGMPDERLVCSSNEIYISSDIKDQHLTAIARPAPWTSPERIVSDSWPVCTTPNKIWKG